MKSEKKARSPQTGEPVLVRIQPAALDAIDAWRIKQPDVPSRAEAIRRLTALALDGLARVERRLAAAEAEAAKKGRRK